MDPKRLMFLLVPDGSAARRVRRLVAARGGRTGLLVGSWPELIDWARRGYLVPAPDSDAFEARLGTALGTLTDAFWAESWSIAPAETGESVCSALTEIISAGDPSGDVATLDIAGLAVRRSAVIAQVNGKHPVMAAKSSAQCPPVVERAEKPVQDNQGLPCPIAFMVKIHVLCGKTFRLYKGGASINIH